MALLAGLVPAAGAQERTGITRPDGTLHQGIMVWTRSPSGDGMAAFYQARGFPADAVSAIRGHCLITFGLHNQRRDKIWLDLSRWHFEGPAGPLRRMHRDDWKTRFDELGLAARFRATFRWTQLPETRDLHPDEPVGGNIALPRVAGPIRVTARFATGPDGTGPDVVVRFAPVQCGPA